MKSSSSRKRYYSVGEVADRYDVDPHKIRYWTEQFEQLDPRKSPGGNRQFRENDFEILDQIHQLVEQEKYTIAGAREKMKEGESREEGSGSAEKIIEECEQGLEEINEFVEQL